MIDPSKLAPFAGLAVQGLAHLVRRAKGTPPELQPPPPGPPPTFASRPEVRSQLLEARYTAFKLRHPVEAAALRAALAVNAADQWANRYPELARELKTTVLR